MNTLMATTCPAKPLYVSWTKGRILHITCHSVCALSIVGDSSWRFCLGSSHAVLQRHDFCYLIARSSAAASASATELRFPTDIQYSITVSVEILRHEPQTPIFHENA